MIEVFFSTNAESSMRLSKNVISSENLVSLDYHLDIGDISADIDSPSRVQVLKKLFNRTDIATQQENLKKVISAAKEGKSIRVWKSNAPFSTCGFAFLCDQLRTIDCKITVVTLPPYIDSPKDTIISYNHWGEVTPDEFYSFLVSENKFTAIEKEIQSNLWQELRCENSPLRAIVNGRLMSVPENFYDSLVLNNLSDNVSSIEELIAIVLGKYPIGVSDAWIENRIRQLVKDGTIGRSNIL